MKRRLILPETGLTRYRFFTSYFIDVDTLYLFLNWFITRVSDEWKYVYGHRIYACINTRNSRASIPGKLHHCQRSKIDLHGLSFQSSPKINRMLITRPFAHNESLQHPTIAVLLIKILIFFRPLRSVHLFQSNERFEEIEFVDRHVSEKL